MATYPLVQRGVITITDADTSPKKVALGTNIKAASAFVITTVRDNRSPVRVERVGRAIVFTDSTPLEVSVVGAPEAWDVLRTTLYLTWRQDRASQGVGITGFISSTTQVRLEWPGTLVSPETIDVQIEVTERVSLGATVRLINEAGVDKVEVSWTGKIQTGDTIIVAFEVFDIENLGDDLKEILFRLQGVLAWLGENLLQDIITFDNPGNLTSYRMRAFDTAENMALATKDITEGSGLETGEIRRVNVTQTIVKKKNVRSHLEMALGLVLSPTPGVD